MDGLVTMELLLKFVTVMLFAFLIQPENLARGTPCAEIHVQAPVVVLGSSLKASCLVPEGCPLVHGRNIRIEWRLNGRIIAGQTPANQSNRISTVSVPSFSDTRADLTCCVCLEGKCQIVEGKKITAGYPPSAPLNVTCLTNLTSPCTLTCKWDPGAESHLPTNHTLYTEIRDSNMLNKQESYRLPVDQRTCTIPRKGFPLYSRMRISVSAQNALGMALSEPLFLDPMDSAKFDLPVLEDVRAYRLGCLHLQWRLSHEQRWVTSDLMVQVRFRTTDSEAWATETKPSCINVDGQREALQTCGLLHGTDYWVQLRVQYGPGPWSDWSILRKGVTLEKAPTGRLNVWLKVKSQPQNSVQLFWEPSYQFRANGKNVSFRVYLSSPDGKRHKTLCRTRERHCEAVLPKGTRRVYITSLNSAGQSNSTEERVYQNRGMEPVSDVTVSSAGPRSLRVNWTRPVSSVVTGYAVEWGPVLRMEPRLLSFLLLNPNQTSLLITAGIEPYRPYLISVYARYRSGIGLSRTAQVYSLQKAPSAAPIMRVGEIHQTHAHLTWETIPPEQRNGIIRKYTIYYSDDAGMTRVLSVKPTGRKVILTNLNPTSIYKAFISASTEGGTVNGTDIILKTTSAGTTTGAKYQTKSVTPQTASRVIHLGHLSESPAPAVAACVGLTLCFIFTTLACFTKHERLKMHFWPMIPDPANSSIKTWTEGDTPPDYPAFQNMKDIRDPVPVHLSWFSLLEVPEGQPEKGEDSTQPLLGEESPSPKSYQNFHFQEGGRSPGESAEPAWERCRPLSTNINNSWSLNAEDLKDGRSLSIQPVRNYTTAERKDVASQLDELASNLAEEGVFCSSPGADSIENVAILARHQVMPIRTDDVVRRLLTLELASHKEKLRLKQEQLVAKVRLHEQDRGSNAVKVAILTARIRNYQEHLQKHTQDKANKRRMLMCVDRRKKLLKHLRSTRYDVFENVCTQLGISYTFPPEYYRRVTKRWLAKKALCIKVFKVLQQKRKEQRRRTGEAAVASKGEAADKASADAQGSAA
ncbi:hypothetical protein SKAU_G00331360 [Synaphobranchus kaupii]|uniref:Small ribosomal subunit protein uS15m n=1 Tax=Synaphobranchus kaupii TaxID=118154 RepID=A0A9Q1IHK7_SYNKA|nr:hypothetical protein SKAU_G00331360 [Synaphobranchus kaupii]